MNGVGVMIVRLMVLSAVVKCELDKLPPIKAVKSYFF